VVVEAPRGGEERGILFFASFVIAVLLTVDVLKRGLVIIILLFTIGVFN